MTTSEPAPIDPDTGLPAEEQTPAGGGAESVAPPRDPSADDPTPPDAPVGDAAGEGDEDTLMSPDLAGDLDGGVER